MIFMKSDNVKKFPASLSFSEEIILEYKLIYDFWVTSLGIAI